MSTTRKAVLTLTSDKGIELYRREFDASSSTMSVVTPQVVEILTEVRDQNLAIIRLGDTIRITEVMA